MNTTTEIYPILLLNNPHPIFKTSLLLNFFISIFSTLFFYPSIICILTVYKPRTAHTQPPVLNQIWFSGLISCAYRQSGQWCLFELILPIYLPSVACSVGVGWVVLFCVVASAGLPRLTLTLYVMPSMVTTILPFRSVR